MNDESSIGERMAVENGTNKLCTCARLSLFLTARGLITGCLFYTIVKPGVEFECCHSKVSVPDEANFRLLESPQDTSSIAASLLSQRPHKWQDPVISVC